MANDSKQVGTLFETGVLAFLRERGLYAERLAARGSLDEGDVVTEASGRTYTIECKARRDRKSSLNLGSWLEEARRESQHYASARGVEPPQSVLVVKSPGKSIGRAFVVQYLEDWINEHTA